MVRTISYREAITEALTQEMARDTSILLMGADVTRRLPKFPGRVLDTPTSEATVVGAAIGAAACGQRPVAELTSGGCFDQIFTQGAKPRSLFGRAARTPVVIRCRYPVFTHVPGLTVVVPSSPYEAKGLLIQSIRDDAPVIFCEHEALYETRGDVPRDSYTIPFGQAHVVREGDDVTIVAFGRMVAVAVEAGVELRASGVAAEIIDPRTTSPLDTSTILRSVEKTGRLVVVDEASPRGNLAANVSALVAHEAFGSLRAPIEMVTSSFDAFEDLPDAQKVRNAAKTAVAYRR